MKRDNFPTVTQAIHKFLQHRKNEFNADLIDRWSPGMETQINVHKADGELIEGTKTYTNGQFYWWNIRVPKDADTDPRWYDGEMKFPLCQVGEAIGSTGWDWQERESRWVGFDFDAIAKSTGISDEQLAKVKEMASSLDYVEVRKSTSGSGLHLYVHIDSIKTANHDEHAQLAQATLKKMSRDCGFNFAASVDVCGGVMWLWHTKMTAANEGLKLLKPATETLSEADLLNWRKQIPSPLGKLVSPSDGDSFDELTSTAIPLDERHKEIIGNAGRLGYVSVWDPELHCLHTHTKVLAEIAQERGIEFSTLSPGTDKATPNCYCWPTHKGWSVHRFGSGREDAAWGTNSKGEAMREFVFPPAVGDKSASTKTRKIIRINSELHRMVDEAKAALSSAENTYVYGQALVEITYDAEKPPQCLYMNGAPQLAPIPRATLATRLSQCAEWEKYNGTSKAWLPARPDKDVIGAVHVASSWLDVPVITGIVSCPVLRADGSILTTPGYDKETGLYLENCESYPCLMRPDDAIALLHDVVCDFPFQDETHLSAWLAFLITLLTRPAFGGSTPFFLFDANTPGTGKGLLTDLTTMVLEARKASRYSWSESNEEIRKLITTIGLSGAPYALFDNITGKFGGAALEKALTTGVWADRILCLNREVRFPIRFIASGTSNNARLTSDMPRRVCYCYLRAEEENPAERAGFRHSDLLAYVNERRRELVMAALSIPAGFIAAGRPCQHLTPWGGFQEWSDLVRDSIVWAGLPDPGETRGELREKADDDTATVHAILEAWPNEPCSTADAIKRIAEFPALAEALAELPDKNRNQELGNLLRSVRDRNIGGKRVVGIGKKPVKWQVIEVTSA